jgi:hypothetical protein
MIRTPIAVNTSSNVAEDVTMPNVGRREPDPPTPGQAARLLNLVSAQYREFGLYLWIAFATGAWRGELLGLRENRFDLPRVCES